MFIVFSLFNFILVYGSLFYILSLKITLKRLVLCLLANTFVTLLALYFQEFLWMSMVSSIVLNGVLFYFLTRDSLIFHHLFVIHIVSMFAEYTALLLIGFFASIYELTLVTAIQCVVLILIQFILFNIIYKKLITRYQNELQLSRLSKSLLLFIVGLTFFVFYALIFIPADFGNVGITALNFVLLLFYFLVMIGLTGTVLHTILKETRLHQKTVEQQQFTHYMEALEQVNRDMQSFRHDYANILLSLRGYIDTDNWIGLRTYFQETIVKVEERTMNKNNTLIQLDRLPSIELKGLLATKMLAAEASAVPVTVEIPDPIDHIPISSIDLTRVMGIFMDNAIEASANVEDPEIHLAFITRDDEVLIVIENRIREKAVTMDNLFREHYSTKGENRGFGLSNVRAILADYPNASLHSRVEDDWFIHEIIVEGSRVR